jgi:hypothetical protein
MAPAQARDAGEVPVAADPLAAVLDGHGGMVDVGDEGAAGLGYIKMRR